MTNSEFWYIIPIISLELPCLQHLYLCFSSALLHPPRPHHLLSLREHKQRESSHMTHDIDATYFLSFHPVAPLSTWLTLWEEALVNDSVTPRHCKCHCGKIHTGSPRSPFSPFPTGTPDTPFSPCM